MNMEPENRTHHNTFNPNTNSKGTSEDTVRANKHKSTDHDSSANTIAKNSTDNFSDLCMVFQTKGLTRIEESLLQQQKYLQEVKKKREILENQVKEKQKERQKNKEIKETLELSIQQRLAKMQEMETQTVKSMTQVDKLNKEITEHRKELEEQEKIRLRDQEEFEYLMFHMVERLSAAQCNYTPELLKRQIDVLDRELAEHLLHLNECEAEKKALDREWSRVMFDTRDDGSLQTVIDGCKEDAELNNKESESLATKAEEVQAEIRSSKQDVEQIRNLLAMCGGNTVFNERNVPDSHSGTGQE